MRSAAGIELVTGDAKDYRQFLEHIRPILAEGKRGPQAAVSRAMDRESWEEKVEEVSRIILALRPEMAAPAAFCAPDAHAA